MGNSFNIMKIKIKRRQFNISKIIHPKNNKHGDSNQAMKIITLDHEVLSDTKKMVYDFMECQVVILNMYTFLFLRALTLGMINIMNAIKNDIIVSILN